MRTKLSSSLVIAALIAAAAGCGKPEKGNDGPQPGPDREESVSLALSSGIVSKTILGELDGDAYPVYWCDGDRIAVNCSRSAPLYGTGEKAVRATFTVEGVSAPYGVVYPSWICGTMNSDSAEITLQTVQKWTPGSFFNGSAVLYGKSSEKDFQLKNLCGVVRIAVDPGKYEITGISLTSLGAPVAGKFSLNLETGELEPVAGVSSIDLSIPDGGFDAISGNGTGAGPVELNFCIPAGEYPEGFNITITEVHGRQMVIEMRENTGVTSGVLVTWPEQTFTPSGSLIITDPESWNTFAEAVNAGDYSEWKDPETGEVTVAANIVSAGELSQITLWDGVLNGSGYVITRNSVTRPLFGKIAEGAVVKNIKLDGLRTEPGENSCAVLAGTNLGTIENCVNMAGLSVTVDSNFHFCGLVEANGGVMRSCTNSADFEINLPFTSSHELFGGGVASRPDAEGRLGFFEGCSNTGNITIRKNASAASDLYKCAVGGILASAYSGTEESFVSLKDCSNEGNITLWENKFGKAGAQGAYAVGGIVGRIAPLSGDAACMFVNPTPKSGFYTEIAGCSNSGTIDVCTSINSAVSAGMSGARQCYAGGIAGIVVGLPGAPAKISGCTNKGKILAGGTVKPCAIAGGILGGTAFSEMRNCVNEGSFGLTQNTLTKPDPKMGAVGGIVAHILKVTPVPVLAGCRSSAALPSEAVDGCKGELYATGSKPSVE